MGAVTYARPVSLIVELGEPDPMGDSDEGDSSSDCPDEDSEYISDNVPPTWAGTDVVLFGGGCKFGDGRKHFVRVSWSHEPKLWIYNPTPKR